MVVEENHSFNSVIGSPDMPFLNGLVPQGALAAQYFANAHPSLPNYFMLTTGDPVTLNDGFSGPVSQDNIVKELIAAGKSWKSYAEGLPSVGYTGPDVAEYVRRHNPFAYFSDVQNDSRSRQTWFPSASFQPIWQTIMFPITLSSFPICKMTPTTVLPV